MLHQWSKFQPKVNTSLYLRDTFTLQVDSVNNLDPFQIISDIGIQIMYRIIKHSSKGPHGDHLYKNCVCIKCHYPYINDYCYYI